MKLLILSLLAVAALTAPAFAACQNYPIITPDNAPVNRVEAKAGSYSFGQNSGTAYTKATFCPKAAAPGTCTGESLSELERGGFYRAFVTLDGVVADIERHRDGFNSPIAIPFLGVVVGFNPTTGYIPGAC